MNRPCHAYKRQPSLQLLVLVLLLLFLLLLFYLQKWNEQMKYTVGDYPSPNENLFVLLVRKESEPKEEGKKALSFFWSNAYIFIYLAVLGPGLPTWSSVQFSSVAQLCLTLCNPMDCSTPGFPVHHQLLGLAQTHVHRVGDAIQPSHLLFSPSPPAFNISQHWGLFQWVRSSHQVPKVLEFQLQHQSFQWIFRTDFL